ncbi:hypothetical protein Catovirus_1_478 [Catovirus CTV1]|uniref:Uncharacterized protein n=1 Tax=Catovirus CTV1 TaxID=1977631 RepID=A0A1V0S9V0_9VIRU|nr:hypothetical protein Catovirus_1_478 [Catovirus CTV1]
MKYNYVPDLFFNIAVIKDFNKTLSKQITIYLPTDIQKYDLSSILIKIEQINDEYLITSPFGNDKFRINNHNIILENINNFKCGLDTIIDNSKTKYVVFLFQEKETYYTHGTFIICDVGTKHIYRYENFFPLLNGIGNMFDIYMTKLYENRYHPPISKHYKIRLTANESEYDKLSYRCRNLGLCRVRSYYDIFRLNDTNNDFDINNDHKKNYISKLSHNHNTFCNFAKKLLKIEMNTIMQFKNHSFNHIDYKTFLTDILNFKIVNRNITLEGCNYDIKYITKDNIMDFINKN